MIVKRRFIQTNASALKKQENLDYSEGFNTYTANDVLSVKQLVYATDTRISTLGRQTTRQGCDFYSVPAGETLNAVQTGLTGASDSGITATNWLGAKFTATSAGRLTKVELNMKNAASATGPIIVEIRSDSSGPSTLLAQSSIPAATPTSAYTYCAARFIEAPALVSGTSYWIVAYIQSDGTNTYSWSTTTAATTAMTSGNSGSTWAAVAYDLNFKTYLSTDSPALGYYRAYKSDGTHVSLLAHGTSLYSINDITGALTSIKGSLSASATNYEFDSANDTVYYVNGYDSPRKWDFTTEATVTQVAGRPEVSSLIIAHKNRMFYVSATDPTRMFFSNVADFETFTSTDFLYIPSPKSPDPIVKLAILNDNLYIFTRKTKWVLFGDSISNMVLRKASGVKGTKAPQSVQVTRNHIYFASDDGFYRFNGSTDEILSERITTDYLNTANKTSFGSAIWNNRYYLFYAPSGSARNSQCWVYNINYNSMESLDTGTYIGRASVWDGASDSGQLMQVSNVVGAVYYSEQASNTYNNLGKKLTWEIRTKYDHYGDPAANKQVKRWYPRFTATAGNYSVSCQYDKDFAGRPTTQGVPLQAGGTAWGSGALWGAFTWGSTALINERLTIPGTAKYIQQRFKMEGVNTPVEFLGQTTYFTTRRPR